ACSKGMSEAEKGKGCSLSQGKDVAVEEIDQNDDDNDLDLRKSTSDGIQFLGGDKLISWSSKTQDYTPMSSTEAEYVSLSACCAQVL
nr:ribonuclease H-like domain-containing protein [Tanacetum cinerariifolium]